MEIHENKLTKVKPNKPRFVCLFYLHSFFPFLIYIFKKYKTGFDARRDRIKFSERVSSRWFSFVAVVFFYSGLNDVISDVSAASQVAV